MKALNAKIDKVTWPGHADNAPDDADKLSKIALEFLQKEENKRAEKDMRGGQGIGRCRYRTVAGVQEKPAG